jgi:hypothetical protein
VSEKSAPRASAVLLVVLVAALATGAAASILVSASSAPPPSSPSSLVYLPSWAVTAIAVGMIVFVLGSFVVWRASSGQGSAFTRMAASIFAVVLLGALFVLGAHFAFAGGSVGPGGATPPNNGGGTTGSNNSTVTGTLNGTGGHITILPGLPGWLPIALLAAVVLIAAAIGIPQTRRYLAERNERAVRRRGLGPVVPVGMQDALSRASTDLDRGGDPRAVILALYASMLTALQPMVTDLGTSTPEEIRSTHLVRLGVRPDAARTLTRLFEEARYSTHPMGPPESARARDAVQAALDDLARRTVDA